MTTSAPAELLSASQRLNDKRVEPDRAEEVRAERDRAEEARAWRSIGFSHEVAARYQRAGVRPERAVVTDTSFRLYRAADPSASRLACARLQQQRVRPVDARRYAAVDIARAIDIVRLAEVKVKPEHVSEYQAQNVGCVKDMVRLAEADISPEWVAGYTAMGILGTGDRIRYANAGLSPWNVASSREKGITRFADMVRAARLANAARIGFDSALTITGRNSHQVSDRLVHVAERAIAEIKKRGGETEIATQTGAIDLSVSDWDVKAGFLLYQAEGWRFYSWAFGSRRASLAYLLGEDDGHMFAVRVPGHITTVEEAIRHLAPAAVKRASEAGKRVLRQGDVYAVESTRDHMTSAGRHHWDADRRVLVHPEHGEVSVPFSARLHEQRTISMGRGSGWVGGD